MPFSEMDLALLLAHAQDSDDLEQLMKQIVDNRNSAPLDDFAGLSSVQMTSFL